MRFDDRRRGRGGRGREKGWRERRDEQIVAELAGDVGERRDLECVGEVG